jgi:hypothetical protein
MTDTVAFSFRAARSGALTAGLALAIVVETIALHAFLQARHPVWAWSMTVLSAITLIYLAVEFRAWGTARLQVTPSAIHLRVPGRATATVARGNVRNAIQSTWRDVPARDTPKYLNLMAPAEPNVLLELHAEVSVRLRGGILYRPMTRLGLHVDEPAQFLAALDAITPPTVLPDNADWRLASRQKLAGLWRWPHAIVCCRQRRRTSSISNGTPECAVHCWPYW